MLRHILFDVNFFPDESERESSQKRVLWLLQALTNIDRLYLQEHPETPRIYQSGIKYKAPAQFEQEDVPEMKTLGEYLARKGAPDSVMGAYKSVAGMVGNGEHFRDIPRIIENGGGDCDNVASWRAAELCELGIAAKPYITWRKRPDGGTTYHVVVLWPDGTHEDPSLLLGMGGESRAADRKEEERKLGERTADFIAGYARGAKRDTVFGLGAITTPQDFSQLQYTIPFQNDDAYEDWSPTRPQGFYNNPYYPNLPSTPGGVPIFNTLLGDLSPGRANALARKMIRNMKAGMF